MDEILSNKSYQLKKAIQDDPRVITLNKLEKEMENNEEVMRLSYLKDVAIREYSDIPDILKEDKENALKKVSIAKANLQNHPLVKQYLQAYKEVKELYGEISSILFDCLNTDLCPNK